MLRKATEADFDFVFQLYMHPSVNPWLLYEMMPASDFQPIYQDLIQKEVKYIYEHESVKMGMCKLVPHTHRTAHVVYLGGLGIHPGFEGKGHGSKMLREIIDLCRTSGFERLELSVSVENSKAIRLYERVGFEKEGVLRKYTHLQRENRYIDEVMMSVLL